VTGGLSGTGFRVDRPRRGGENQDPGQHHARSGSVGSCWRCSTKPLDW